MQVVKATAVLDVGCAINPTACEAADPGRGGAGHRLGLDGGVRLRRTAGCVTPALLDYRLPTALDAPNLRVRPGGGARGGPLRRAGHRGGAHHPRPVVDATPWHDAIGARVNDCPSPGERVSCLPWPRRGRGANGKAAPGPWPSSFPVRSRVGTWPGSPSCALRRARPPGGRSWRWSRTTTGPWRCGLNRNPRKGKPAGEGAIRYGKEVGGEGSRGPGRGARTAHPTSDAPHRARARECPGREQRRRSRRSRRSWRWESEDYFAPRDVEEPKER